MYCLAEGATSPCSQLTSCLSVATEQALTPAHKALLGGKLASSPWWGCGGRALLVAALGSMCSLSIMQQPGERDGTDTSHHSSQPSPLADPDWLNHDPILLALMAVVILSDFFFFPCLCPTACGILLGNCLFPKQIEPRPSTVKAPSSNHWSTVGDFSTAVLLGISTSLKLVQLKPQDYFPIVGKREVLLLDRQICKAWN